MKEFYGSNKDFKDYVERYMRNKDVTLEEVLGYKQTRLVAEQYREVEAEQALKQMGE